MIWLLLKQAILQGESRMAVEYAKQLLDQSVTVEELLDKGLTKTLESVGHKCMTEEFNLLEILLAGRALMDVMDQVVTPRLEQEKSNTCAAADAPAVILGTIQGDVHDLGKNITRIILQLAGYRVIDLGKDVPPKEFALAAKKEQAKCIGISSLLSTTVPLIKEIRPAAKELGLPNIFIMAGGGMMTQCGAEDLGVDFVAADVFTGLQFLNQVLGRESK